LLTAQPFDPADSLRELHHNGGMNPPSVYAWYMQCMSHCKSVNVVTRLWAGWLGFDSWLGVGFFLFATMSRLALRAHPASYPVGIRVKRPECESDHLPPSSAEVRNEWIRASTLLYVFTAWYLVKYRILHGIFT